MLKNYLKIAWRTIRQNKLFAAINISGLTIGIVCCLLIGLYLAFELSYDRFFKNAGRIYRVIWRSDNSQTRTPHPLAQAIVRDLPGVEAAVSLSPIWGPGLTRPVFSVRCQDKRFDEQGFFSADSTFFDVFSFRLIRGDETQALTRPGGIVITQKIAQKYFGHADPMGKTLRINDQYDLTITGVMENIPANTHFHFDFLISYVTLKPLDTGPYYTWADFGHYNYILLKRGADPKQLEAKLPEWSGRYINWSEADRQDFREGEGFRMQPLTGIHLHSDLRWELEPPGNIANIYIFSCAALFILIIACVNFMNLMTARSLSRAREVGLRKSAGAFRFQLIIQFLAESVFTVAIAVGLALVIMDMILPWFNRLAGIQTSFTLYSWKFLIGMTAGAGILGIAAGSYPAFVLSKFKPAEVLKGKFVASQQGLWLRKGLVILQFTISVTLIAGTLILYNQLGFLEQKDLGFDKEQVAVIPLKSDRIRSRYKALKDQLSGIAGVQHITTVSSIPGGTFNQQSIRWRADDPEVDVSEMQVDHNFTETLGIKLVKGRSFSKDRPEEAGNTFLLNETAARQFDWDTPINKEITFYADEQTFKGKVIGVVEDFHFQSLHQTVSPLIIQVFPEKFNYMLIKLKPENITHQLAAIEEIWHQFEPVFNFEYSFLDHEFEANYRKEQKAKYILFLFSGLAIIIACMGLYGLTSFALQQRVKEIGVRKVSGATVADIVALFSKDFMKLVAGGFVFAIPVTWYVMNRWLANFAYRIEIGAGVFLIAGGAALFIALITVSWQSIRAALANPVESLRSE